MTSGASPTECNAASSIDLLCFDVGSERFAIPLAQVDRVAEGCDVMTVNSGARQRAVLRIDGALIPVHEPSRVLHAERAGNHPVALLLDMRGVLIALLVDSAETALEVPLSGLRTPARLMRNDRVLDGLLRVQASWVRLVNSAALVDALSASTHEAFPVLAHAC